MKSGTVKSVNSRLAEELAVAEAQIIAAVRLLDEGATVPFIARYRKEVTGSLDDGQLRTLEERLSYLRELDERRDVRRPEPQRAIPAFPVGIRSIELRQRCDQALPPGCVVLHARIISQPRSTAVRPIDRKRG